MDPTHTRILNVAVVVPMMIGIAYLISENRLDATTPVLIACGVALVVINIGRFNKFKYGAAEFEAVTDARKATEEVYASMEHLRGLATTLARINLELLVRAGRLGAMSDVKRVELKRELQAKLNELGLSTEQRESSVKFFDDFMAMLHIARVLRAAFEASGGFPTNEKPVLGFRSYQDALDEYVNLDNDFRTPATELRKKLKSKMEITAEVEESMADYDHYLKETFRRPDLWDKDDQ